LALERGYKTLVAVQRETLDNLYEGIAVFGTDSRLRLVNPSLLTIWRLSSGEVEIGAHMSDLFKKIEKYFVDYDRAQEMRSEVLKFINARTNSQGEFTLIDERIIRYTYVPLPDGSHLFSFVDVSNQKEFERSLQQRTYNLETTEKIKNNFLSHISYELKSPINTIVGFSEILLNGYFGELNEKQLDYCKGITDSAERLMYLINDMLDLASIEAGTLNLNYQETSLTSIIVGLESLVQNHIKDQGLELLTSITTKHEYVIIDQTRLKHALFNILNNAIKFTPAGGSISINVEDVENDDNTINISIQDTGVGISQSDQERIFHMFEQGIKPDQRGVGIGLTLVKSLVALHKGSVKIESNVGIGTKVSCFVPVSPLAAQDSLADHALNDVHGAA
jgi:signal transduction histidine kinase